MKPLETISRTLLSLTLLLFACTTISAQNLTEALQKQVWPESSALSPDEWENLLPATDGDTLFYPANNLAEVVALDTVGRPNSVIVLQLQEGKWIPQTRTIAAFDAFGNLVALQSWKFEAGKWGNESKTIRQIDHHGNDVSFELLNWEGGEWKLLYMQRPSGSNESLSAKLMP
jgi:hypothetical protein